MKRASLLGAATAVVALSACQDPAAPSRANAPAENASFAAAPSIDGQYIVVFNDDATDVPGLVRRLAASSGADVLYTYTTAIKGFAGTMSAGAAEGLSHNPHVAYVEVDQPVSISTTQSNATWGLDRIDQRALPLSGTYSYTNTGTGVNAYIIDTGIRFSHSEFGGRAVTGYDAVDGGAADDCNGHGTHVAGTVGGGVYGVAKNVKLVGVRVLDCAGSGTWSGVIAGMDWVAANHVKPAVANMSLGGGLSTAINDAVARMTAAGVVLAVAAGNDGRDACRFSPAAAPSAITVGATTKTDSKASYSNYGTCLDIFAPGSGITSAWYQSDTQLNTISGTSMASPHVAGVAALYLQSNPGASPSQVDDALSANSTKNVVTSAGRGSLNYLLYSNY